ncbi:cell division cycle protein 16 homolog [Actinia tenebrosa]|uniref:Cell division cycle protein 16 homolog n=1 Tax=Actinia tenebrosa TaxID=6105 RepID=A0A6P8J1L9_ACTTE|nr:cell division cycle protein 16 homolog [Actinia tenebrosa]
MATGGKIDISQLRNLIRHYLDNHQYKTALFWADKTVSLSKGEVQDVYWFAQTLFLTGQFQRASHALKSRGLVQTNLACRYLAAKCHSECKQWQDALDILDAEPKDAGDKDSASFNDSFCSSSSKLESVVALLKGTVYEAMDNRSLATECYKEALSIDVHCYEAFDLLISHHMLTDKEERHLLDTLPFQDQCTTEESDLLKFLYESRLQKYTKPEDPKLPATLDSLNDNLDIVVNMAERHFYNCSYSMCHKMTSAVLNSDPYHESCLPIHISCLVELRKANSLFYFAHKLVDNYPQKAVSWYAVGCYYYLIEKYEQARRYFSKSTAIERVFGPAWLGFGHSFAAEGEHDQAMAAYFTASKLMPKCHLPLLYIGLEYGKTNNMKLAERFFTQALTLSPKDPFVLQEMGVIEYQNGDYPRAEKHFKDALEKAQNISGEVLSETWETLLSNLGHTYRKLGEYEKAMECYRQALVLVPNKASAFSAIGFVHSLRGNHYEAIDYFHKALGIQREDTFSVHMLGQTLEQLTFETQPEITATETSEISMEMDKGSDEEDD